MFIIIMKVICLQVQGMIKGRFSCWQEGRSIATQYTRASIATNAEQISLRASFSRDTNNALCNGRTIPLGPVGNKAFHKNNNDNEGHGENGVTKKILMDDEEQL